MMGFVGFEKLLKLEEYGDGSVGFVLYGMASLVRYFS